MSSNLGLVLSMFFVALTFLFGADLIVIQSAYTALQNDANDVAYFIMKYGYNDGEVLSYVETYCPSDTYVKLDSEGIADGDTVWFSMTRDLSLFLFPSSFSVTVTRGAVVGYYD